MKEVWKQYRVLLVGLIASSLLGGTIYVATLVVQDTTAYKQLKSNGAEILILKNNQRKDSVKLHFLMEYIVAEKRHKKNEYQVGLRFRTTNKKLYYRDSSKEYRIIKHDSTGDYYRDENDNKVFINDKW